jgi:membrane-associated phospholipid phosphatase
VHAPPEPVTPTRRGPALVVGLVATAVWVVLGIGVATDFAAQLRLDGGVSEALYAGDNRAVALNDLLQVLTFPGTTLFRFIVFLTVVLLLLRARAWWTAGWVLTAILLIGPLTTVLKELFGRIRPDFQQGGARLDSLSYPSGHSSGIATLVTVTLVLAWPYLARRHVRRLAVALGVAMVLLVGLTRMWLGVHFLSDVVGGWALGLSWSLLTAVAFSALPGGRAALPGPARQPIPESEPR